MLKFCMQDYKDYGVVEIDHGSYTVNGRTCIEAQINGLVSRVNLSTEYDDIFANRLKAMPLTTKDRKRKLEKGDDSKAQPHKKRTKQLYKQIDGNTNVYKKRVFYKHKSFIKIFDRNTNSYKKHYLIPKEPSFTKAIDRITGLVKKRLIPKQKSFDENTEGLVTKQLPKQKYFVKTVDGIPYSHKKQLIPKQKSISGNIDFAKKQTMPKQSTSSYEKQMSLINEFEGNSNSYKKQMFSKTPETITKLNGDQVSGKRVRKPNSKFSDYIVPANYNLADASSTDDDDDDDEYDSDSGFSTPLTKPKITKTYSEGSRLHKTRVKEHILANTDDDQKLDTQTTVDPLDLYDDDIVHSFLPMFEPPPLLDYDDDESEQAPSSSKTKAGDVLKTKDNVEQAMVGSDLDEQPATVPSPNVKSAHSKNSRVYGKVLCMPLILTTNSQNAVVNVNDVSNQKSTLSNKYDQRWVQIQPKPIGTPPLAPLTPDTPQRYNVNSRNVAVRGINPIKIKAKIKDSFISKPDPKPQKMLSTSRYALVDQDSKHKPSKVSDIDFNKLVRSLKLVKLPAKNWKIRIIVSPQETITEVIFTNKEVIERCVKFSRVTTGYKITFGKSEVKLLGVPTLQTFDDIALLLEIIHTIDSNSIVLEYC